MALYKFQQSQKFIEKEEINYVRNNDQKFLNIFQKIQDSINSQNLNELIENYAQLSLLSFNSSQCLATYFTNTPISKYFVSFLQFSFESGDDELIKETLAITYNILSQKNYMVTNSLLSANIIPILWGFFISNLQNEAISYSLCQSICSIANVSTDICESVYSQIDISPIFTYFSNPAKFISHITIIFLKILSFCSIDIKDEDFLKSSLQCFLSVLLCAPQNEKVIKSSYKGIWHIFHHDISIWNELFRTSQLQSLILDGLSKDVSEAPIVKNALRVIYQVYQKDESFADIDPNILISLIERFSLNFNNDKNIYQIQFQEVVLLSLKVIKQIIIHDHFHMIPFFLNNNIFTLFKYINPMCFSKSKKVILDIVCQLIRLANTEQTLMMLDKGIFHFLNQIFESEDHDLALKIVIVISNLYDVSQVTSSPFERADCNRDALRNVLEVYCDHDLDYVSKMAHELLEKIFNV